VFWVAQELNEQARHSSGDRKRNDHNVAQQPATSYIFHSAGCSKQRPVHRERFAAVMARHGEWRLRNDYFGVNLLNSSPATCVTGGYVGVSAYDPAGDLISASESRDLLGSNSAPTLSVAPGASIHFVIGLPDTNVADGGTECSNTVGALHLIPPNETTEVQIATPVARGYPSLCGNTFMVGPLQSGATND
jgi:hypothetical protein